MSLKSKTQCVVCHTHADAGKSLRVECGHRTHTACLAKINVPINYTKCPQCLGHVDESVSREVDTLDGVDYVVNPPTFTNLGALRAAATNVLKVLARSNTVDTANPFSLLCQGPYQMPITSIIRNHDIGLQHMIKAGVTIDDFLDNGYSLEDLKSFKDLSGERGDARAQLALSTLQLTADHMRIYGSTTLPIETLRNDYGVTPEVICSTYGLTCPEGGYVLSSPLSEDWLARDVVALGFKMDDLLDYAKMEYQEQYFALEATAKDEIALGATLAHVSRLSKSLLDKDEQVEPLQVEPLQNLREPPQREPLQNLRGVSQREPLEMRKRQMHGLRRK